MFMRIDTVARDKKTLTIYVVVEFWAEKAQFDASEPPTVINDFLMQLAPDVTAITIRGNGNWVRADGVQVSPENITEEDEAIGWQRTTSKKTNQMVLDEVEANILSFWDRAKANGYTGDRRSFHDVDDADPDGVLTIAKQWVGRTQDYPER